MARRHEFHTPEHRTASTRFRVLFDSYYADEEPVTVFVDYPEDVTVIDLEDEDTIKELAWDKLDQQLVNPADADDMFVVSVTKVGQYTGSRYTIDFISGGFEELNENAFGQQADYDWNTACDITGLELPPGDVVGTSYEVETGEYGTVLVTKTAQVEVDVPFTEPTEEDPAAEYDMEPSETAGDSLGDVDESQDVPTTAGPENVNESVVDNKLALNKTAVFITYLQVDGPYGQTEELNRYETFEEASANADKDIWRVYDYSTSSESRSVGFIAQAGPDTPNNKSSVVAIIYGNKWGLNVVKESRVSQYSTDAVHDDLTLPYSTPAPRGESEEIPTTASPRNVQPSVDGKSAGAWGPGPQDNDDAMDAIDVFRDKLESGATEQEAYDAAVAAFVPNFHNKKAYMAGLNDYVDTGLYSIVKHSKVAWTRDTCPICGEEITQVGDVDYCENCGIVEGVEKEAWTSDGSDITPVAAEIMDALSSIDIAAWNNGSQELRDSMTRQIVDRFKLRVTQEDLDCLTDYNYHTAVESLTPYLFGPRDAKTGKIAQDDIGVIYDLAEDAYNGSWQSEDELANRGYSVGWSGTPEVQRMNVWLGDDLICSVGPEGLDKQAKKAQLDLDDIPKCPICFSEDVMPIMGLDDDPEFECNVCGTTFQVTLTGPRILVARKSNSQEELYSSDLGWMTRAADEAKKASKLNPQAEAERLVGNLTIDTVASYERVASEARKISSDPEFLRHVESFRRTRFANFTRPEYTKEAAEQVVDGNAENLFY